ncbi:MAG: xanthine dehydrogenase family protein molybdopterin-binding subunit [Chloroflexota bacterium]|nr:xanthine dehydrogenase family protein molybdopterin-binding subunit [Chloroflexota bacterium]
MTSFKVLETNHPRLDAIEKVTGSATYASDVYLPGMLMCKLLLSTESHAKIVSIDVSAAENIPGVRAVITGHDYPEVHFGSGGLRDRYIMPRDEVFYVGEPIAAVAADNEIIAQSALDAIKVLYEPLPNVVNSLAALDPDSPTVHPDLPSFEGYGFVLGGDNVCTLLDADRGDVDEAFGKCDFIVEDVFQSQGINQGFLEPMACIARSEPNGRMTIWASTQGPYQVRSQLATVLQLEVSQIKVIPMELGGGFGAKLRLAFEAYPALLSIKCGQPVKLINTRAETFTLTGPRLPVTNYIRSGINNDGTIMAREAYTVFDVGAYLGAGPNSGVGHGLGAYHIPNYRLRSYGVYTNKVYVGSYRASGVADMTFAVESHTDNIANKLGIDPIDFRMKNAIKKGDIAVNGSPLPSNGLMETLEAIKKTLNKPDTGSDRGIGVALCEWRSGSGPSTAAISVNEDGTISLLTGSVDISGSDTSLAAIAAETLGISLGKVIVAKRDTDLAPFTGPSGGSRIIYSQGTAVQRAAEDTKAKLFQLASERLGVAAEALICEEGMVYVQDNPAQSLDIGQIARLSLSSRGGPIIGTASLSNMPYTPVFSTHAAEVLVDKETGQVKVTRYIQAQDVGVAINPMSVEGQLDGGAVQGIGRALTEDMLFDMETGSVKNPSFATYLMPLAIDMPDVEDILIRVPAEDGPFGARAVAEPPGFGPPAAIANAIYDAIGIRINELPLSPERVLQAIRGKSDPIIGLDIDALKRAEE